MAVATRTDGSDGDPRPVDTPPIPLRHLDTGGIVTAAALAAEVQGLNELEQPPPIPATVVGVGRHRKIALIGSAESIACAPWFDLSWEIWCHATCHALAKRVDRFFDQHPWEWIIGKNNLPYLDWLKTNRVPIYMAERRKKDAPASIRYPLDRLRSEYPLPFGSHTAYMVALALSEGVSHLGFFGIHYTIGTEYEEQRANAELWAGVAFGKGVQLVIPPSSPFCHEPRELYAYDSHKGPDAQKRWQKRQVYRIDASLAPRGQLTEVTAAESATEQRGDMTVAKHVENLRRQAAGEPALLPNGRPAW